MRCRRRGWTLLEMLLVITVSGTIMWGAGTLAVSLLQLRAARRIEHDVSRSLLMLQQQWRDDVHAATRGTVDGGSNTLTLDMAPGVVIEYRHNGSTLQRTRHDDGRLAGRDEYSLPAGATIRWEWPRKPGVVATLAIEYPPSPADPRAIRTRTFNATVGTDHRLSREK